MNKKGQALVEFIIILPIFILLIFGVIDMGRIMITKMNLEANMHDVIDLYKSGKSKEEIKNKLDLDILVNLDNEYTNISLKKEINLITPGLQIILNNPYIITVNRSILNE